MIMTVSGQATMGEERRYVQMDEQVKCTTIMIIIIINDYHNHYDYDYEA